MIWYVGCFTTATRKVWRVRFFFPPSVTCFPRHHTLLCPLIGQVVVSVSGQLGTRYWINFWHHVLLAWMTKKIAAEICEFEFFSSFTWRAFHSCNYFMSSFFLQVVYDRGEMYSFSKYGRFCQEIKLNYSPYKNYFTRVFWNRSYHVYKVNSVISFQYWH